MIWFLKLQLKVLLSSSCRGASELNGGAVDVLDLKVLAPAWMNACLQWDERTWCSCWRGAAEGASAGVVDLDVAAMGETRRRRGTAAASESPPECVARVGEVHQLCFLAWGPYLM